MFNLLFYNNRSIITFILFITISILNLLSHKSRYNISEYNILSFFLFPIFSAIHDQINITKDYLKRIQNITNYKKDLKKLEENLIQQQITTQEKDFLINENLKLKKELLYQDFLNSRSPYPAISAKIIYRTINYPHPILILNRGRYNNIETGMPVVKFKFVKENDSNKLKNIVIGRIGKVNEYFSQLIPISSVDSKIYSKINGTPYTGFVSGISYESQMLFLEYLDKLLPLKNKHDIEVVTSSESIFPEGIKIGKVIKILTIENNVKKFIIEPYFKLSDLDYVFILKKSLNLHLKKIIEKVETQIN